MPDTRSCPAFGFRALFPLLPVLMLAICGCAQFGSMFEKGPSKNPCVVLALPDSGPYASTSAKIKKGADEAKKQLLAAGINLRLENINTAAPDWLAKLEALPQMCTVVGGPINEQTYLEARKSGELEKRVFFSFMPNLHKGDEGVHAWRFFPGPEDQIDALVHFVTDELNIRTYGVMYPDDNYGKRMAAILEKKLSARHMPLQKAAYNPKAPATWANAAKTLINPVPAPGSRSPIPQTTFEAIFLPDSWKNMELIAGSLVYNGEDRLVLLGPMLWEQALTGKKPAKAERYALAVFPGAWNREKAPQILRAAANDFWVALGYDFINFAVNTNLDKRPEAAAVTAKAQAASSQVRALAPISWDGAGIASQHLYIFQVGPNGPKPLDIESFRQTLSAVKDQAALRIQGLYSQSPEPEASTENMEEGATAQPTIQEALESDSAPNIPSERIQPASTPANTGVSSGVTAPDAYGGSPVISNVPQPSYKLRLPAKRP